MWVQNFNLRCGKAAQFDRSVQSARHVAGAGIGAQGARAARARSTSSRHNDRDHNSDYTNNMITTRTTLLKRNVHVHERAHVPAR